MQYIREHLRGLTRCGDAEARQGFLCLDMNESAEPLPEAFVRKVLSGLSAEAFRSYPEYGPLLEALAAEHGLEPGLISLSAGSDSAIRWLFESLIEPGDSVLLTDPTFAMYPIYCRIYKARAEYAVYPEDLSFPAAEFLKRIVPGLKLAVLVNPNNPAGSEVKDADLAAIIERCAQCNTVLAVDEAYFDYLGKSVISQVKHYPNLAVLRTFSKLCAMAGARLGYVAASAGVIAGIKAVRPTFEVGAPAVALGLALLKEPGLRRELLDTVNSGKAWLAERLAGIGIECRVSLANFLLLRPPLPPLELEAALRERRILVKAGFSHPGLQDWVRVSGGSIESMGRFFDALTEVLSQRRI